MMLNIKSFLYLATLLTPISAKPWTGFNYGAFWAYQENVKGMEDFRDGFNYAKNLTATIPFDSARLFTCKRQGSKNTFTGAFDAAVETKTNLLLGFWITPEKRGDPFDDLIKNEMAALEAGFSKHGKALADLVIGLSVGSEDIHRFLDEPNGVGLSKSDVSAAIKTVKALIASSYFAHYMKGKPIGHVDTAKHAVVEGADFYGMTAYPYWNKESIENAKLSFLGSLEDLKQRAGNTSVWIAEMGWPYEGAQQGQAVASANNLQMFWDEVGCSTVGMYPTFWFELLKDTTPDQPDWAVLDTVTKQPRIKNFTCAQGPVGPNFSSSTSPASLPPASMAAAPFQNTTTSYSKQVPTLVPATVYITTMVIMTVQPTPIPDEETTTFKVTSTAYVNSTLTMSEPRNTTKIDLEQQSTSITVPWCITVADVDGNGQFIPMAGNPVGPDGKCTSPPAYTGLPYAPVLKTAASSPVTTQNSVAASSSSALISLTSATSQVLQPSSSAVQAPVNPTTQAPANTVTVPTSSVSSSIKSACTPKLHRVSPFIASDNATKSLCTNGTLTSTPGTSRNMTGGLTGFVWPIAKPVSLNGTNHV